MMDFTTGMLRASDVVDVDGNEWRSVGLIETGDVDCTWHLVVGIKDETPAIVRLVRCPKPKTVAELTAEVKEYREQM